MNQREYNERFHQQYRRKLRRELDEMGYGRTSQMTTAETVDTVSTAGLFMIFVTVMAVALSLAISNFVV